MPYSGKYKITQNKLRNNHGSQAIHVAQTGTLDLVAFTLKSTKLWGGTSIMRNEQHLFDTILGTSNVIFTLRNDGDPLELDIQKLNM